MFAPFHDIPKVTIFGSARTQMADPLYMHAREVAAQLAAAGWMVVTGAGPGIMQAGDGGRRSRHVDRRLDPPAVRAGRQPGDRRRRQVRQHEVLLHPQADAGQGEQGLRLPARRLRHARRDVRAADADPDGQGPAGADRASSTRPGDPYWETVHDFVGRQLVERGLVAPADTELYLVTDDCQAAVDEVLGFYAQLRLDPLRRSAGGDADEAGAHRRPAGRRSTIASAICAPSAGSSAPRRSIRSARRTTSSTWLASPSPSPSTRYGDVRELIDTVNSFVDP